MARASYVGCSSRRAPFRGSKGWAVAVLQTRKQARKVKSLTWSHLVGE